MDKIDVAEFLATHLDETHVEDLGLVLAAVNAHDYASVILETDHGDFRLKVTRLKEF